MYLLIFAAPGLLSAAAAQAQSVRDTARHVLPTVQVQAARPARYAAGSHFTSLDSTVLAAYQGGTVAEALSARTPLYLKTYGPGQLASLSIRGTSARHSTVLWHGFSLNFATLGEADLALLPAAGLARVDVQHGPAAALYGSGAVGGAVVLGQSAVPAGTQLRALAEAGSFGSQAFSLSGSQRDGRVSVRTSFLTRRARNDFPYSVREFSGWVRQRQENAAQQQSSFQQDVSVQVGQRGEVTAAAWFTDANRQIQPLMGSTNDHAQERDQSGRVVLGYRHRGHRGETLVRAAWFGDLIDYRNDQLSTSHSRSSVRQAQAEHTLQWQANLSLRLGVEAQQFVARVDGYDTLLTPRPVREARYAGFALLRYDPSPRLRLTLNARQPVLPGRAAPLCPTAGAEWQLWASAQQQLWLKASAARSYRAPTLNERYWSRGGRPNLDLQPENGLGYDGGLRYEYRRGPWQLQTELTGYRLLVDNWVQWAPSPNGGGWVPRNLRQVRTQGLEATGQLGWQQGRYQLKAAAGYAFTHAQKTRGHAADPDPVGLQLPYVPRHTVSLNTDHSWRRWLLSVGGSYTGARYLTASANDELPAYFLAQGSLGHRFALGRFQLTVLAQGFNLTNTTYQNYAYRAMPPRSGVLSLRVAWL
ncbi:TonB-dependent receptor [Hymenobacter sp. B81]|uniref:TonB-dependent receptor n=1 Tax=Hymenobacter sp. B81 TaxID=3344878 RepID=UPI0037DD935C